MIARALLAVLVLPALFAGLVPWIVAALDPWRGGGTLLGAAVIALGIGLLALCVRDFLVIGRGTLAPWDPPRRLVVVGLYRFVRNPMYLALFFIVVGVAITAGSPLVLAYLFVGAIAIVIRTIGFEEPQLAARFGDDYARYRAGVPRWLPRLTPWQDRR